MMGHLPQKGLIFLWFFANLKKYFAYVGQKIKKKYSKFGLLVTFFVQKLKYEAQFFLPKTTKHFKI